MDVGSISASPLAYMAQTAMSAPESAEMSGSEPDNDSDDAGMSVQPASTVNAMGQTVGQLINVTA